MSSDEQTSVAEWVLPGHPDKLCDAIADRFVGEIFKVDAKGQIGIEVACAFEHVFVTGLIGFMVQRRPQGAKQVESWVRETYASAGYGGRWCPRPEDLRINLDALRIESRQEDWQEMREFSDDQCICVGYAQATPQTDFLPGARWWARRIAMELHEQQKADPQGPIGPDGKVIVRGRESADGAFVPEAVSMSLHHDQGIDWLELRRHAEEALKAAVGSGKLPDLEVNGAGMFVCGGPTGDNGTTGKKLVMDAYGPSVPIGGGAWSGKDPHKPDRAGAILARKLALEILRAVGGHRVLVQLEYRPNSRRPESIQSWIDGRPVALPSGLKIPGLAAIADELRRTEDWNNGLIGGSWARWGWL